jgi:hypothetical protein
MTLVTTYIAANEPATTPNSAVAAPSSRYSSAYAPMSFPRVAPSVFSTTAS